MRLHRLLALFIFLSWFQASHSQNPDSYPVITRADLPEAKISHNRIFNGASLFGYIDGGAEIYLEYGFSTAIVTEISIRQGKYKTEIYKMNGQEEAFGMFSVSKYRCLSNPELAEFSCLTKYQLQFCKGPYYINIINSSGTESDSVAILRLGRIISDKINDTEIDLSYFMQGISREAIRTKSILVKGRLGIINGLPDMEDFFREAKGFTAFIMNDPPGKILSIRFLNNIFFQEFIKHHNWDAEKISESGIIQESGVTIKKVADCHLLIELPD